jgi:hypothetical protein
VVVCLQYGHRNSGSGHLHQAEANTLGRVMIAQGDVTEQEKPILEGFCSFPNASKTSDTNTGKFISSQIWYPLWLPLNQI